MNINNKKGWLYVNTAKYLYLVLDAVRKAHVWEKEELDIEYKEGMADWGYRGFSKLEQYQGNSNILEQSTKRHS